MRTIHLTWKANNSARQVTFDRDNVLLGAIAGEGTQAVISEDPNLSRAGAELPAVSDTRQGFVYFVRENFFIPVSFPIEAGRSIFVAPSDVNSSGQSDFAVILLLDS